MKENIEFQRFREIVYVYKPDVYRIIASVVEDHYAADELSHVVMIKAWKGFAKLKNPERSKAWVKAITRNVLRDYMSENVLVINEDDQDLIYELESLDELKSNEMDILDALIQKEDIERVFTALNALDEKYRRVIKLNLLMDKSLKEIADEYGLNPGTVRMIYSSGMKKLVETYKMLEQGGVINA